MIDPSQRSRAFNFALKAQSMFGTVMGITILWSLYNLLFIDYSHIFISKILLTMLCLGFAIITPLIDFNESHATNPLWTGHARFHLVWQVNAMIFTALLCLSLLWVFDSLFNLLLVVALNFLWIFSFIASAVSIRLYDGEFNDINGVPPIIISFLGTKIEIDRNIQAISAGFVINSYALIIILT